MESHQKEIKSLGQAAGRLHVELQRVNGLIAQNAGAREALSEVSLKAVCEHLELAIHMGLAWATRQLRAEAHSFTCFSLELRKVSFCISLNAIFCMPPNS